MVTVFTYWILECLLAPAPPCPLLGRWLDACLIYPRWTLLVVEPGLYPLFPGWTHHHWYSPNLPLASNCSLVWQGERAVPLFQSLDCGSLVYHFTSTNHSALHCSFWGPLGTPTQNTQNTLNTQNTHADSAGTQREQRRLSKVQP